MTDRPDPKAIMADIDAIAESCLVGLAWSPGLVWDKIKARIISSLQSERDAAEAREKVLLEALKGFMDMWGSREAHSESKAAQKKRAVMWERANAAYVGSASLSPSLPKRRKGKRDNDALA